MERNQYDLLEVLEHIDPAELDYQQWVNIGMALELEGYSVEVWDNWSRRDPGRYHSGECQKKWRGFRETSSPVTGRKRSKGTGPMESSQRSDPVFGDTV